MQGTESPSVATRENQITERYGLLLSQTQLAEPPGRTPGGLHYKPEQSQRCPSPRPRGLRERDRPARLVPGCRDRPDHRRGRCDMTTTILRAPRRQRFLVVDQRVVENERLSWTARWVVCSLLSRPDNWKVLARDPQKRGDLGRDGICRVLRELLKVRYAEYHLTRDAQGRIRGGVCIIHEVPLSPHPDLPQAAGQDTEPPDPARPESLPNTERNKERTATTRQTTTHKGDHGHSSSQAPVEILAWVAAELRPSARRQVAALEPPVAQMVIDG